jgi:hypothetical protein
MHKSLLETRSRDGNAFLFSWTDANPKPKLATAMILSLFMLGLTH